ncbi:MAG TPA: hypothetical protein VKU00_03550 [Chthonomonadaceae bacterium]|nr:hypothetical protein [Chthonomonadaceae bacterium]
MDDKDKELSRPVRFLLTLLLLVRIVFRAKWLFPQYEFFSNIPDGKGGYKTC